MSDFPLQGRRVWAYVPTYTGTIHAETVRCMMKDAVGVSLAGGHYVFAHESYNAMIAHIRNVIVAKFLEDKAATDLLFVDWDVTWPANLLPQLLMRPVDVVSAIYPKRQDETDFFFKPVPGRKKLIPNKTTGLLEVGGVPAGFLRLSRRCLERMVKEYKDLAFACSEAPGGVAWGLFDQLHEGKIKTGEDYSFCERWRRIGGKVWVYPDALMTHTGMKTWEGNFADYMEAVNTADKEADDTSVAA